MANTVIGRVVATEKNPTTIDNFTFWTDPELILNPFDIQNAITRLLTKSEIVVLGLVQLILRQMNMRL